MRFIEIPALITEDIEDPSIVDITEPITVSISGTTMTINGQDTDENSTKLIVSGEATVTLTGDTTVDAFTLQNIRAPSLHKISVKTNNKGNFTYVPNNTVTASSVSTTTKTGSDFEILLITTNGGETYVDFDMADYTSPALYTSNALTGFDISELTSTYGATAKLYKPDGTLLTTVNSATTGGGVNFGYTESLPGDVEYKLEVTDDLGRKSTYNLPRKWINYAMGTGTTPGFQKFRLEGTDDDYTTTVMFPSLGSSSTAKVYRTSDHGYLGINFKIQGRNSTGDDWVDIANADEDDEVLAFGDFLYHRVWVKPTAKATTTVSSSNVVTLTLSNLTEENVTTSFDNFDPYDINESTNTYVFEETTKIGTVPFTVTLGTETYTNAVTATTEEVSTVPNTDMTAAGPNMKHTIVSSWATLNTTVQVSGDGKYIIYEDRTTAGKIQVMKGDPENGYTNYTTITYTQGIDSLVSAISYDGKYILFASWNNSSSVYEMHLNDESAGTYSKLSTTYSKLGNHRCYAPAFIPRSGNYDFVLTGSDNNATCYIRLYKHNTGTDTWTAKSLITDPTNKPTGDENRGYKAKSFTSDGKYLMFGNMGVYGGYEMYTIDWDANTAVFSGANYSNNGNVGASGAVSFDGKYVLIFHTDSNSRKIFKNNDAGDWSSATDVTTDFTFADTDNDQGHGFSFCGEHSEFFVSGMNAGAIRMYSWYAKNSVTLTFSNPTLTLTGQNVTISSAKLYRDDVLFHTYGTESNVVLRSDQTGTYQAVVNDVYYSNRVTPDFTTTRSVSAPQLEFDGYNRLNLSNITPTSTTLGLPDGTTRDLTTQSNVYIYEPGTYTANVQTSETFAYLSNVVTSQPSQNPTDVGPTFTFDEYNRLAISNITQTSSTLKYGSNTYDTNTASNVYVTDMGEYKLEARDANTFVMSNVYVGAVSQHPSDVVPTLTFDGYKKLTIDNVDTIETATIKKDGAAFATTTSNTIYIRDTGTYTAEVKGSNVYVTELSKQVNTIAMKTDYTNIWAGEYGGMVVDSDGKLYTWGDNGNNESGRGASDRTPTHISTISDPVSNVWVEGAAGRTRIVKTSTDKWYMWGMNSSLNKIFGQTGDQTAPVDVTSNFTTHFGAQGTSDTTRIIKVVMSSSECSALADDGKVWSWGGATNLFGSVGHTLTESSGYGRYVCTSVSGVNYTYAQPNKPLSYGYNISFVADSSTGSGRYTGVWNANPSSYGHGQPIGFEDPANVSSTGNGQNGGSYVPSYTPTHSDTTLYLYSDNGLWYTISVNYATTIPVPFKNTTDGSTELSNITDIRSLDSGKLALDSNGDVWQWGTLRTGSTVYATKQTGLDSVTIIGIGTGFFTAYAWDATGTIYSIGRGTEGQLGNGANSDQDSTWQTVTTLQGKTIYGIYGAGYSVFAHTSDGVYACGQGTNGRLGMGNNNDLNVFTKSTALSALSIYKLDFGHGPGYIITTDGKGYALGYDYLNSIPTPLSGDKNVPTEASSLTNLSLVYQPPAITYDGKNKLTVTGTNYEDTATVTDPNGSTYNIGTAKTMYVKDAGEYVFKISGTDKYVESNVYVSSVDLAGAPTKPIDFDGYNKLTLVDAGSNVSANVTYFSNTYELGSANVLYINGTGTYDLEMSGSNVFALSSNVVGTVSQHPTDVVPSLTFDNYNKLTLENFTGSILSDVNSVNASVTKVSGGGTSPDASSINSHVVLSNGDKAYHYNYTNDTNLVRNLFDNNTSTKAHGTSLSAGEYYEWGYEFVSSKKIGSMTFKTWTQGDTVGNISIYYYDGTTWKSVVNPSALGYDLATEPASYAELEITFSPVTATHFKIWVYAHPQSSNSNTPCISEWTLKSYKDGTLTDPNGDTYSLGQTQDTIYIKDQGDYFLEVTNSDQSAVVKTNVGSVSTPDPNQVPLTVTGLSGWYTGSSFNTSNNQWEDISGNDRHMTETQGTMNVDSTGINQKAYVYASRYDGIRLPVTAHSVDNHTPNYTFFFVGKWTADNNIRGRILDNVSAGYFSGWYGRQYSGHSRYISPKNSAQNKTTNNTNITGDDWALVTDFNYGFRINGIDRANNSTIAEGGFTQMGINYGYYNTGTYRQDYQYSEGCSWAGAELICYNRTLTANEISLIEGYLQSKYLISNDIQQVLIPSLTFDNYNKLSIENLTPTSTTLRFGSNTYEIGTASNVYIEDAGTYKVATGDANTFALVSNVVGTVSQHPTDVVPSLTYDTSNKLSIENLTPTSTTLTDPNGSSFDIGTASNVYIRDSGKYSIASKDANTFVLASNTVTGTPTGTTYVYDSNTFTTPSQTYDTTKTITVKNVPSTLIDVAGKIYKGSTAYPIHATTSSSNVIIKNTGTYVSVFTTATQAFLTNAIGVTTQPTTTSDDTTIEDEVPIVTTTTSVDTILAFHYGSFDTVYGDADVTEAANNGHIFDDTPSGTYDWGTLGTPSTASNQTTYTWTPTNDIEGAADVLIVAGGGGGGGTNYHGGGGGAGGVIIQENLTISGQKTIVVGDGAPGHSTVTSGYNSSFDSLIAIGGGTGGNQDSSGNSGGSGGGSGVRMPTDSGGAGTPGQGFDGGGGYTTSGQVYAASGGGGAGGVGENGSDTKGGDGGIGISSDISGTLRYYAGGGGGSVYDSTNSGLGGLGGGGDGAYGSGGGDGERHTGSGGGGRDSRGTENKGSGNGGSGIVILKYTETTTTTTGGLAGSTAVPDETSTDAPSVTLDATDTTVTDPTLDLDFTTQLPRNLKRYNGVTNSSIGARFNRRESRKKRIEKSISIPSSFSAELTANNASSPTTLTVTVANSKFVINGDETPTLAFIRGETYTFDQSDASNSGHPLVLVTSADGATQYTTGWTTTPSSDYIPGVSGAQGTFIVPYDVPDTIYYKCNVHPNMGGEIHTTFGNAFSLGDFTVAANTHVSGEYTLATNYDGTTSNLYVNGDLISQTTPSPAISAGVKDFILGKEFDGYVKNFKFWNYAKHFILFTNPNFTGEGVLNSFSGVTLEYVNTTGVYANYIWKTSSGNIVTDSGVKFNVVERRWYDVRTGDETDANNKPYHFEIRQGNASSVDASGGTASNPSGECINGNLVIFRGINDDNDWLNSIYMSGIV